jgi:hypothetical protein
MISHGTCLTTFKEKFSRFHHSMDSLNPNPNFKPNPNLKLNSSPMPNPWMDYFIWYPKSKINNKIYRLEHLFNNNVKIIKLNRNKP